MTRAICFLFMLFILAWVFQWSVTCRKINEIKQSSDRIEKLLDERIEQLARPHLKDQESWQRAMDIIEENSAQQE